MNDTSTIYRMKGYFSQFSAGSQVTAFVFLCFFFLVYLLAPDSLNAQGFRAAVVKVDITPEDPQLLAGYASRKSTGVHDPIFHRILVLDDGTTQLFLISTDIVGMSPSMYDRVAAHLKSKHSINPLHLWWTVTHTHSAPK